MARRATWSIGRTIPIVFVGAAAVVSGAANKPAVNAKPKNPRMAIKIFFILNNLNILLFVMLHEYKKFFNIPMGLTSAVELHRCQLKPPGVNELGAGRGFGQRS